MDCPQLNINLLVRLTNVIYGQFYSRECGRIHKYRGQQKTERESFKKIKRRETVYLCWVTRNIISHTLNIKGNLQGREAKGEINSHIIEIFNAGQDWISIN